MKGDITVLFTNTSDIDITIHQFYLDFYFNGQKVGYVQDLSEFTIIARQSSELSFEFTLEPQLIIGNIVDIIGYITQNNDASIVLDGFVTAKSGFVKATIPIKYETTANELLQS